MDNVSLEAMADIGVSWQTLYLRAMEDTGVLWRFFTSLESVQHICLAVMAVIASPGDPYIAATAF